MPSFKLPCNINTCYACFSISLFKQEGSFPYCSLNNFRKYFTLLKPTSYAACDTLRPFSEIKNAALFILTERICSLIFCPVTLLISCIARSCSCPWHGLWLPHSIYSNQFEIILLSPAYQENLFPCEKKGLDSENYIIRKAKA